MRHAGTSACPPFQGRPQPAVVVHARNFACADLTLPFSADLRIVTELRPVAAFELVPCGAVAPLYHNFVARAVPGLWIGGKWVPACRWVRLFEAE